jgi:hypothetical protein
MSEEQMNRLESIIKNWLNNGAQCTSSLKPYTRSLYPTYNPRPRTKRADLSSNKSQTHQKSNRNPSIKSKQSTIIQMCEDFLRNHRDLLSN